MPVKSFALLLRVHTPAACSARARTFPNGRHFEGFKHLWIYIYIYLYIFSYAYKQLDSKVRSLIERGEKKKSGEKEGTWCGHGGGMLGQYLTGGRDWTTGNQGVGGGGGQEFSPCDSMCRLHLTVQRRKASSQTRQNTNASVSLRRVNATAIRFM